MHPRNERVVTNVDKPVFLIVFQNARIHVFIVCEFGRAYGVFGHGQLLPCFGEGQPRIVRTAAFYIGKERSVVFVRLGRSTAAAFVYDGIGAVGCNGKNVFDKFFLLFIGGTVYPHRPAELTKGMYAAPVQLFG